MRFEIERHGEDHLTHRALVAGFIGESVFIVESVFLIISLVRFVLSFVWFDLSLNRFALCLNRFDLSLVLLVLSLVDRLTHQEWHRQTCIQFHYFLLDFHVDRRRLLDRDSGQLRNVLLKFGVHRVTDFSERSPIFAFGEAVGADLPGKALIFIRQHLFVG